jgi:hypothetical protein
MKRAHRTIWMLTFVFLICSWIIAATPSLAAQAILAWDPNQEGDMEGYGVYYRLGADGPPYDLFGYVTTAELTAADAPSFTVTGLQEEAVYHFAVTAYDTTGNESAFSESVCAQVGATVTACADTNTSITNKASSSSTAGNSGSSGGGGGGGCFISTTLQ